ncbi:hypothetical protein [Emticicia sp. TH156]|uniref:hypothetical protein n=1 Tax=Emticicia sp. TH156 TaxID=2067454 RepID=UPI000CC2447E|nr:hypothetical protein [Emticicia sp. TH156]PLK44802.1 hypothetical protein C0V77_10190 [Emticicia sp. TH156]
MKPTHILCIVLCLFATSIYAQDIIFMKTGEEIKAKVKEVKDKEISYLKFDNLNGPTYTKLKSEVVMIKYENGQKDIFADQKVQTAESYVETSAVSVSPLGNATAYTYEKGIADALIYYNGENSGKTGTLLTSLLINGLVGLIPAVACSSTTPKVKNLGVPNMEAYQKNPDYARGYQTQAKKIKSKKIWKNWGIGTAISTLVIIIASNAN